MAIRAMGWLSKNLGIDITGENSSPNSSTSAVDKLSQAVFGQEVDYAKETEGRSGDNPAEEWAYAYDPDLKMWAPSKDAPQHIQDEFRRRVQAEAQKDLPQEPIAPPPMPPAHMASFNRDVNSQRYVNAYFEVSPTSPPVQHPQTQPELQAHFPSPASHFPSPVAPGLSQMPTLGMHPPLPPVDPLLPSSNGPIHHLVSGSILADNSEELLLDPDLHSVAVQEHQQFGLVHLSTPTCS